MCRQLAWHTISSLCAMSNHWAAYSTVILGTRSVTCYHSYTKGAQISILNWYAGAIAIPFFQTKSDPLHRNAQPTFIMLTWKHKCVPHLGLSLTVTWMERFVFPFFCLSTYYNEGSTHTKGETKIQHGRCGQWLYILASLHIQSHRQQKLPWCSTLQNDLWRSGVLWRWWWKDSGN